MYFIPREDKKSADAKEPVLDEDQYSDGIQSKNPGYPGFSMEGFGYGGGLSVSIYY